MTVAKKDILVHISRRPSGQKDRQTDRLAVAVDGEARVAGVLVNEAVTVVVYIVSWRSGQTYIHTDRQTDRQTHTHTHTHTYMYRYTLEDKCYRMTAN